MKPKRHCAVLFVSLVMTGIAAEQSVPARKDIPEIARAAIGSIVSIIMSNKQGQPVAQGSGFFISKDGWVVTNYHVINGGSSALIKLPNGTFFAVDGVIAADKDRDIAIIKARGDDFRMLTLGDSDQLQVGEEVVAIGSPLLLESTVSNGIVSGIREMKASEVLQITAPISHGSSGGPLFDMSGEVIGITTFAFRGGENLNFAIPINALKSMLENHTTRTQTPLGVRVSSGVQSGLLIRKVAPTYPPLARQARIQGTVVLQAQISKDGNIENLQLISGHPMLVPAAIQAVKQWKYRPYLLKGEPVEVETQVQVNFTLAAN
jgi:TonB family protein